MNQRILLAKKFVLFDENNIETAVDFFCGASNLERKKEKSVEQFLTLTPPAESPIGNI